MSLKLIELNDLALRVGDASGELAASPGFALLQGKEVILGAAAEEQRRLHPTDSYDKFWHELNMEPLRSRGRIRHHADLAYSQLIALAREANIDGDVILAVPGHFSREQLGLLLGIAGQCPFRVAGMVDSALAAAAETEHRLEPGHCLVHAALHLHQTLLTRLQRKDGELFVKELVQVPQLGRQQLLDALMRTANQAFIRQCRFNPQHEAASEQQLYSLLTSWTGSGDSRENLVMELNAGASTHTAKLPHDQLLAVLHKHYQTLLGSLRPLLEAPGAGILLDQRLARLPGAMAALGAAGPVRAVRSTAVMKACLRFQDAICVDAGRRRIQALPLAESTPEAPRSTPAANPTHILFRNRALPVDDLPVVNNPNGGTGATLALDIPGPSTTLGRILLRQSRVLLDCGGSEFQLNDAPVAGIQPLRLGDRIRLPEVADEMLLIEVSDGRRS